MHVRGKSGAEFSRDSKKVRIVLFLFNCFPGFRARWVRVVVATRRLHVVPRTITPLPQPYYAITTIDYT